MLGGCPNRFKLASFVASKCELSNRKARDIVAGLQKNGYVRQAKVKDEETDKVKRVWVVKGARK